MFFQINVTPKEKKTSKVSNENDEARVPRQERFELVLAPFQAQTRIKLESTVYNSVQCSLRVRNPSNRNLNVTVSKLPPSERSIVLSASDLSVKAETSSELEIVWTPQESGSWRDTLQLTDSRRIKYDVALITTAQGVKKVSKGRSRILGPANTNKTTGSRRISPPAPREVKKNINTSTLNQLNVPSKRPRLNSQPLKIGKENAEKTGWTYQPPADKQINLSQSPSSHDFSAIMNSTKFNLTPLNPKACKDSKKSEIDVKSTNEIDFSPQEMGIISPEIVKLSTPILRRETYVTATAQQTKLVYESHEFSAIMDSTNFNFTPLKPVSHVNCKQPEITKEKDDEIDFSPQVIGIISPEIASLPILRRETYVAAKNGKSMMIKLAEQEENEEDENFMDSLSPQPEAQEEDENRKPSDFSSNLINDMNSTTPKTLHSLRGPNFSPNECSTGKRTKTPGAKLSSCNESPVNLAGNNTFDISSSKATNDSRTNGTYELSTSPTGSKNIDSIRPTRLSRSFGTMSPFPPENHIEWRKKPVLSLSSTPISIEIPSSHVEYSTRTGRYCSNVKNYEDVSVRDVLEADLWVKSHEQHSTLSATKLKSNSLDRIVEEKNPHEPLQYFSSSSINRTQILRQSEKSTKIRRLEISPPKKHFTGVKCNSVRRISPTKSTKIRKEKSSNEPVLSLRKKVQKTVSVKRGHVSISGVRIANLSLAGLNRSRARDKSMKNEPMEVSVKLHDPNDFLTRFCNPDPFGATMTQDPFLTSTLYYDDKWIHHQEIEFKKWLNALLTPPEHLSTDVDTIRVDVGKVWQSCRSREDVALAETREAVSSRYHTNTRLNTLRKAACAMFRREEVSGALSKATVCVERGTLMIREDRDLHRDIGLQKEILELFLSYNPLWLRIGLETVYGETIPLHSNNDLVGLTKFLITRFFSDPFIVKTHSHATIASLKLATFTVHMNKFILKKFLLIVYFLDHAKRNKLIGHDPCLFHKKASHKDSRAILLTFAREVLKGVGDLTKVLRSHGYVVSHKQTYLDEYDYAVNDISADLRDGVRLCRVMELITGDRNLTSRCRVPAISRLQKVHNAEVALSALLRCGFTLTGEIDAKSVADGHREKTLSLLWQIIYKYQAPRFEKAANCVQRWWRSKLWYLRVRNFLENRRDDASSKIQRAWRCYRARKELRELREERARKWAEKEEAVRVIQLLWRRRLEMLRERRNFLAMRKAALCLQRSFRRQRETGPFVEELRGKRRAVKTIQNYWRAQILMRRERKHFLDIVEASKKIQTWWRARKSGREARKRYRLIRNATIIVQSRWRALRSMQKVRESFRKCVNSAKILQSSWRRYLTLKRDRNTFLLKKNAVKAIEAWWIGWRIVNIEKKRFRMTRNGVMTIQRNWRRYLETRDDVERFKQSTKACCIVQQWWRSVRVARHYQLEKKSCVTIQRWWRGVVLIKFERASFETARRVAITLQKIWRMKRTRGNYLQTRRAIMKIQCWYRNARKSRDIRQNFVKKRDATLKLQNWWRNLKFSRKQRCEFVEYRKMVITVQTKWRAILLGKRLRLDYLQTRAAITKIQATWKMICERRIFLNLLERHRAATILQIRWRETLNAKKVRKIYVEYRSACIVIQNRYRELRAARKTRANYLQKRKAAIVVQKNWRMLRTFREYKIQKKSAVVLQSRWRARNQCLQTRTNFLALKDATLKMQRRYRAKKIGQQTRQEYLELRSAVLHVQARLRANKSMKEAQYRFLQYRRATIVLQSQWKMIIERRKYRKIRQSILTIQSMWRARKIAKETRIAFVALKMYVLFVQRRYRANKLCRIGQEEYAKTREKIIRIQRLWREKLENRMREEAAINIQTWWKSILAMRECKKHYQSHKVAALVIQKRYRAYKIGSETRQHYLRIIRSIIKIQRSWRYFIKKKLHEEWLRDCKSAVLAIENWWIIVLREKREREAKLARIRRENEAATKIQSVWKGHKVRTSESSTMRELRQRSERAARAAVPSATVAFQLRESMDMFLVCDTIGQLTMCLAKIDILTRYSLKGCIEICKLNLVDKIYWTLDKSNRSIPWMDVCLRCTSILITLAKLEETKKYVYKVEFIETLARLLTITIEHHVNLFLHLATLLWLLSDNPDYAKAITNCPRTIWLLSNLHVTINKKKNRLSVGSTNKSRGKEQTAPLPNSKPDWGLTHKRPRLFTTVHHAISSLIKRLKIDSAT